MRKERWRWSVILFLMLAGLFCPVKVHAEETDSYLDGLSDEMDYGKLDTFLENYGVEQVYGSTDWIPRETYTMTIAFDTNAEMADELCEIILKELRTIAEEGPLTEDIEKHREFMLKNWKNSLDENGPWMQYLQAKYGSGLDYLAGQEQAIRSLTNADVQALAKKILDDGNMVKVVMHPEANEDK